MGKKGGWKRRHIKARREHDYLKKSHRRHIRRSHEIGFAYIPQFKFAKSTMVIRDIDFFLDSLPAYDDTDCKKVAPKGVPPNAISIIPLVMGLCHRTCAERKVETLNRVDGFAHSDIYVKAQAGQIPTIANITGEYIGNDVWVFARQQYIVTPVGEQLRADNGQIIEAKCHTLDYFLNMNLDEAFKLYPKYVDYQNSTIYCLYYRLSWTFAELGFDPLSPYTNTGFRREHVQVLLRKWGIPCGVDTAISGWVV